MSKDLSQAQVNRAEDHIAYEGMVQLLSWIDTSAHGFKITLGLADRGELDHFDGVMKLRKNRGGHRYHCIVSVPGDLEVGETHRELHQFEAQFAGRGWAETKGAHIALHVGEIDTIAWLRMLTWKDQVEAEEQPMYWELMMMELGDDETIVNQAKRARVGGIKDPQPKGGPRSKAVAMLLQDPDFLKWLSYRSLHKIWNDHQGQWNEFTPQGADKLVKFAAGIRSKREFDTAHNADELWQIWETQFHRPFLQWLQRRGK